MIYHIKKLALHVTMQIEVFHLTVLLHHIRFSEGVTVTKIHRNDGERSKFNFVQIQFFKYETTRNQSSALGRGKPQNIILRSYSLEAREFEDTVGDIMGPP